MALGAREAGYEVHVAAPRADGVERIVAQGFQYHHIQLSRWGGHPMREFRSLCSIYRVLREVKPDLVHQVTIKPVIYGGLMARLAGRPAIVSAVSGLGFVFLQRGLLGGIVRNAARLAYKLAFAHRRIRVIFQNPDDRAEFIARGLVNAKKTVLIKGSGVNVRIFAASPEPQGAVTVVFPSRMLWDKGLREFVDAAGKLRSEGITARFALVGNEEPGNPASASTSQLQQWHDSGVVEWWGYRGDMFAVFAGAHLALFSQGLTLYAFPPTAKAFQRLSSRLPLAVVPSSPPMFRDAARSYATAGTACWPLPGMRMRLRTRSGR